MKKKIEKTIARILLYVCWICSLFLSTYSYVMIDNEIQEE